MSYIRIGTFCPECGEFIDGGAIIYLDGSRPANTVCLEDFAQAEFYCERCGTSVYTPDYESMCEIEEGELEYEEYDEGEEDEY